jgi:hypothetical protein
MSDDPLTTFIGRSLRGEVTDARSEIVTKNAAVEVERIRFRQASVDHSLALKRVPPSHALEVHLLPLLARKTDRVPRVFARGVPPASVPAWPWVMTEDLLQAMSACHEDPRAIVLTKVAIERAVAADGPALKALGVPTRTPVDLVESAFARAAMDRPVDDQVRGAAALLGSLPPVLCHGELVCSNVRLTARGVVLVEWREAYVGCGLLDMARLAQDVDSFSGGREGDKLFGYYGELTGMSVNRDLARAAKLVEKFTRTRTADQDPPEGR